jgi:hypothetical protein
LANAACRQPWDSQRDPAPIEDERRRPRNGSVEGLLEDRTGFLECRYRSDVCAAVHVIVDETQAPLFVGREDRSRRDRMASVVA